MDIEWLEDFLVLSGTGNFSTAAESRNVSQPAFSRRIRALEHWIGTSLLDRSTYPATLTNSGMIFKNAAERLVTDLYRSRDECLQGQLADKSEVSFSGLHTLALTFFPKWLKQTERELGLIKTRMMAGNVYDCVQSLTLKHSDFLLYYTHNKGPVLLNQSSYPSIVLATENLVPVSAVADNGQALFSFDNDAEKIPYLAYTGDTFLGKIVNVIVESLERPTSLDVRYSNSMSEALKTMALEGHGLTWLPESCVKREFRHKELVQVGTEKECLQLHICLARNGSRLHPESERLWSWLARSH